MARGINFETREDHERKADLRHQAKYGKGPTIIGCSECGDEIGPWWGDGGEIFCSRHAPHELKYPGKGRDDEPQKVLRGAGDGA